LTKGRIREYAKEKFHSLYVGLVWAIVIGALVAVGAYVVARFASNYYIGNFYSTDDNREIREQQYINELRDYVSSMELSSEDTDEFARWARGHRYVYLLIYKDDELFFTSDMQPDDKDSATLPDSNKPDVGEGPGTGITVDYPTREELLEYAQANDLYPIELSDGTIFASIAEFTEYLYYDIANMFCLALAMVILAVIIINYFRSIISRIKRLETDVTIVSETDMTHPIRSGGYDEISKLSANVENMRNSILENLKKEREAREANKELITAMSHDIRTPLTVLFGYLDIMKECAKDNELMYSYVTASENTAMRLKQLSDDMFKYSLAFGSEEENIALEEYNAWMLLEQMLSEHILLLRENGYDVVGELTGEELDSTKIIRTDAQNLMRIIDNVFSNIYKYADKNKPVEITVETESDEKVIIEFKNRVQTDPSRAESNGIGLKTCTRLGRIIADGFEYRIDKDIFTARLTLRIYDPKA